MSSLESTDPRTVHRFDAFTFDPQSEELSKDGKLLPLSLQPCRILGLLLSRAGHTVSREEIQRHVWGDDHVAAELGINSCLKKIRSQLGDDPRAPTFVMTVPRRGYRFIGLLEPSETVANGSENAVPGGSRNLLLVASVIIATLALWALTLRGDPDLPPPLPATPSVAIVPFTNLSNNQESDYLAAGLTDETIARLARLDPEHLRVIAGSSTAGFKLSDQSVGDVAAATNAQFVVTGSWQTDTEHARATVQLVDGKSGLVLATEVYDAIDQHSLIARGQLAASIAQWLAKEIVPDRPPFSSPQDPIAPDVYELYLLGLHHLQRATAGDYRLARNYFQRVTEKEAGYAPGWPKASFGCVGSAVTTLTKQPNALGPQQRAQLH